MKQLEKYILNAQIKSKKVKQEVAPSPSVKLMSSDPSPQKSVMEQQQQGKSDKIGNERQASQQSQQQEIQRTQTDHEKDYIEIEIQNVKSNVKSELTQNAKIEEQKELQLKERQEQTLQAQLEKRLYPQRTEKADQLLKFVDQNVVLSKIERLDRNKMNSTNQNVAEIQQENHNLSIQINEFKKQHSTNYMKSTRAYLVRKESQELLRKELIAKKIQNPMYQCETQGLQEQNYCQSKEKVKRNSKISLKDLRLNLEFNKNQPCDSNSKRSQHQSQADTRPTTTGWSKSRIMLKGSRTIEQPYTSQNLKFYQRYAGTDQDFIESFKPLFEQERQSSKNSYTYSRNQDDISLSRQRPTLDNYKRVYSQQGMRHKYSQVDYVTPQYVLQRQFHNFPFFLSQSRTKSQTEEEMQQDK
eukprot:TRINITY_DN16015_c0_g1_i1.p1 TRINITY_DN16015_c0_g1~~TRINITY_DN16015_c0_g1_i1.p1  ORF type:complete len:413 (+),score=63.59 TRINITY_DN16015_c0_g1_i1:408-1646(+)